MWHGESSSSGDQTTGQPFKGGRYSRGIVKARHFRGRGTGFYDRNQIRMTMKRSVHIMKKSPCIQELLVQRQA